MAKDPKFSDPQLASEGVSGEAKCCKEAFCNMVFIALGLLLLVAAALKGYQLYIEPMIVVNALGTLCLVCWEISLGSWLVLGVRTTWTWRATVGCFLVFTIGSGYKLINGAASCGCFGKLEVDPLHTLIVDMIALGFLWTSRQGIEEASSTVMQRVLPRFATIALLACVVAATTAVYGQSRFTRGSGLLESTDELVLLEPETWVGKRWPLIFESGLEEKLTDGEWDVLLFRHDCHTCHEVMTQIEEQLLEHSSERQIALVGIDQQQFHQQLDELQRLGCAVGYLPADREWFASTPIRIQLDDTICVAASVVERW